MWNTKCLNRAKNLSKKMSDQDENSTISSPIEEISLSYEGEFPLICAEFNDAYSFRNLIEYLNLTNDDGNFVFTPKEIYYSRENDSRQVLNELVIRTHELTRYEYNATEDKVIRGVNLVQFKGSTKKIGKKDIARIEIYDSGICVKIIGSPKNYSGDDMDIIRTQRLNHQFYTIEGYQEEDEPNFTESIQKFTGACTDQASCRDDFVTVVGLERGVIFEARQGGNLRASIKCLGQVDESAGRSHEKTSKGQGKIRIIVKNKNEIVRHRIPRRIIAALGKLTNICPNGTVKVYIQPDLPIKLVFHVSTYGKLTIYLRQQ